MAIKKTGQHPSKNLDLITYLCYLLSMNNKINGKIISKKNIILVSIALTLTLVSVPYYVKIKENQKKLIRTRPLSITSLKDSLELKKVNIDAACIDSSILTNDVIDLSNSELKEKFTYLCEDQKMAKELEENFSTNSDYKYFLDCAKRHAANMQQITTDLKEHYTEDYKQLNFNKDNQESILNKYLKHPRASYLMAQCESKMEALYWRSIINSSKVEDLKFCQQITEDCINGKTKAEECPTNFKAHHDECVKKLGEMKH